jgi:CheY-like chemotaxis protein
VRQALLNLLSGAARCVPGGRLEVSAQAGQDGLSVHLRASPEGRSLLFPNSEATENLSMARQLADLFGARLEVASVQGEQPVLTVSVVLSAAREVSVLVVDDNEDTLQLLKRYLSGSRYTFVGTTNPEDMMKLALAHTPRVIVLDVMVPGVDGWQLLSRLREHPATRHMPVLVCTILPLERLALSLGATAFIRKPVSREALLSALDQSAS